MSHSIKEIIVVLIVTIGAIFCTKYISRCSVQNIDITCDVKEPACIDFLNRLPRK